MFHGIEHRVNKSDSLDSARAVAALCDADVTDIRGGPAHIRALAAELVTATDLATAQGASDRGLCFQFGAQQIDDALNGGLPVAALHEVQAADAGPGGGTYANASALVLLMALRAAAASEESETPEAPKTKSPILWIGERQQGKRHGWLYPPGLPEIGIDPARILYANAPDMPTALRVAADGVRSAALSAIILSASGARPKGLDLTATRRLSLFARESGVPVMLLRDQPSGMASSAWSRWEVAPAPSRSLPANAPGQPVFDIKLTRHRGGKEGASALLEWNRETQKFEGHTRAVPAISVFGKDIEATRKRA